MVERWACVGGPLLVLGLMLVFAGWTGADGAHAGGAMLLVLAAATPLAVFWLAAAAGIGAWLQRWLLPRADPAWVIALGLGVTALTWIDATLGRLGLLNTPVAWAVVAIGVIALLVRLRHLDTPTVGRLICPGWILWASAPALAVLLLAATSAPGWLWSTEFGGYDALAYHLLLPREWMAAGRIEGLEHNVYAFLPGYVEAAYLHLAVLRGDAVESAPAAQVLHAMMAIATALAAGAVAGRGADDRRRGVVTATLLLVTPWVVVTGSLAYNEMAVLLLLVAGLATLDGGDAWWRRGLVLGALAAGACGAKLTAAGFVAAPLGVLLLAGRPLRPRLVAAGAGAAAGLIVLAPWLAGNALATGNPVFPFLGEWLGYGHWTPAQAATWREAHVRPAFPIWRQWLAFGIGPRPTPVEPWAPLWFLLPWLGLAGLAVGRAGEATRGPRVRLGLVLLVQVAFWGLLTHGQSRFLLPTAVPLALLASRLLPRRVPDAAPAALLLALSLVPVVVFRGERGGQPAAMIDWVGVHTGRVVPPERRVEFAAVFPELYVRFALPPDARVLLAGESAPFYFPDKVVYTTTWDRGPLSEAIAAAGDDWPAALARAGFTHVLVKPELLARWADAGWNDPAITPDRVLRALDRHARVIAEFAGGIRVYAL